MVAAKSLLAGVVLALAFAAAAAADDPTVRIAKADQLKAETALLKLKDFGVGWKGGRIKPEPLTSPKCPGFDPKESDLTVTGHAQARFTYPGQLQIDQDVQVLESAQAVATDFSRVIGPKLAACLELKLKSQKQVVSVTVQKLTLPQVGDTSAAYRGIVVVRIAGRNIRLVRDYIFIGQGRMEYSLAFDAPANLIRQLAPFEQSIAQKLVKAGANVA